MLCPKVVAPTPPWQFAMSQSLTSIYKHCTEWSIQRALITFDHGTKQGSKKSEGHTLRGLEIPKKTQISKEHCPKCKKGNTKSCKNELQGKYQFYYHLSQLER